MINIQKLLNSSHVEVSFLDATVDKEFVKQFRKDFDLTQVALANVLGVTKKTIEKWEQGVNNIGGSSAVLLKLLKNNPTLINQIYSVRYDVKGEIEDEYKVVESKTINTPVRINKPVSKLLPLVAII